MVPFMAGDWPGMHPLENPGIVASKTDSKSNTITSETTLARN